MDDEVRVVQRLLDIMRRLRDPREGCPWDLKQDFQSIAPYTIEEAYEVADAIERKAWNELRSELGDLLLQVVFHAQMASERGLFTFEDVVNAINDKMVRRHPHVFAGAMVRDAEQQTREWEAHKRAERGAHASLLDDVPRALPALARAEKLQMRAAAVGFDWNSAADVLPAVVAELAELEQAMAWAEARDQIRHELGDLFFTCTNLARHLQIDADGALRGANERFERRFRRMELLLRESGEDIDEAGLERLDELWQRAKSEQ